MPFVTSQNQASRGTDLSTALGALTATGQSASMDVGGAGTLRAQVQVSAVSGTSPRGRRLRPPGLPRRLPRRRAHQVAVGRGLRRA
jgi:hypothetical protein